MEGEDQPLISTTPCTEMILPEWVGMRLEGDRIRNLDKLLIPDVPPSSV